MPDNNDGETTIDSDAEAREAAEVWESAVAAGDTVDEEEFDAAFDEFAAEDDTKTAAPPAEGREDEGQPLAGEPAAAPEKAETTEDHAASGDESSDDVTDAAAPDEDAAKPEDIWADATPEQRAAFEAAQTKLTTTEQENRSHRGRASELARREATLNVAPKPAAEPAADTPATVEADKNWEQFKTDYPEVAGPMEQRFETRMAKLEAENTDLRGRVTGITDAQTRDATNTEEALLVQRHPDWEQLTTSEAFNAWFPGQPRYVQEGFARNGTAIVDGQEAASLIDLFKDSQAPSAEGTKPTKDTTTHGKATRRQRRLESAVQTESGQAGPGAGPPEGDFDASWDHFAALP